MSVRQDAIGEKVAIDLYSNFHVTQVGTIPHKGITNKFPCSQLGHFLSSFATFFSGTLIATVCCWEVALLTFLVVPLILAIRATYTAKMNIIAVARVLYQSEATFIVEQVNESTINFRHLHFDRPVLDHLIHA